MNDLRDPNERRPDPDALLALARKESRGALKVFLGAAPGVGKTYAMLSNAQRLARDGADIVVGIVETHGRSETAALLDGLEILPRRPALHKGHDEFDLNAALARRPRLIIVDELAHTNAPDSRHPKRYQDIEELLAAGIDVWTALNIQHLESLSDIVAKMTGVTVRETVPDIVIEKADEVVVVDITPAELIERLKAGKIYLPDNAHRAVDHFFKPGNLTALRELALRRTAHRVDGQMLDYLRQNAIEGPWPTGERLLALVGTDESSALILRTASRLAHSLNASWIALHIERHDGKACRDASILRLVDERLVLAERLGAEVKRLSGRDLPSDIVRLARRENVTQIVVGRSKASLWSRLRRHSLTDEIVRLATDIGVHIVTDQDRPSPAAAPFWHWPPAASLAGIALGSCLSVSLAVAAGTLINRFVALPNMSVLFLTAVLFCAVKFGRWAAIAAAFLSFFAYNFFFIEPLYTFTIAAPHELFALLVFLIVAIFTGGLAGQLRDQADSAHIQAVATQSLYEFSRKLSGTADIDNVLWAGASQIHAMLGARALFALEDQDDLSVRTVWPPDEELGTAERTAMRWAFEKKEPAGWRTGTLPNIRYQFRPLATGRGVLGICGFEPKRPDRPLSADDERMLAAVLDQTAIALDRSSLAVENTNAAALMEGEKLKSALFSSISHDLRTPLASITGAVTSLREYGAKMSPANRGDLLLTIEEEAARLSRFVGNLIDMSRVESGRVDARREWIDVGDVVRAAVDRARQAFPKREIKANLASNLPPIKSDSLLLGQVIFNLLDNAHKYTKAPTPTVLEARQEGAEIVIHVTDEGRGIPAADLDHVFEKFYRGTAGDGRAPGTGLGLAICQGLIEAMGGTIRAKSPFLRGQGTRMTIRLPIGAKDTDRS